MYSPAEASRYLAVAEQTLAHWRVHGRGPKFIHLSKRCVRYSELALREFVESRTRAATCEE
ncbi:MAG: DNA-binding protein [Alphaproteobacteria bacterium]|nr:DNA-binding protein [Alphaproteobacteria bacterium]